MPQPKKNPVTKIVKKGAEKLLTGMQKKAVKSNAKLAAKEAAYIAGFPKKQAAAQLAAEVKAAKKAAGATLKNAGKAGSPLTAKVVIGPKTRKKMAEGKFGSKVKQGPAAKPKSTSTGNVKVKDSTSRDPFAGINKPTKKKK